MLGIITKLNRMKEFNKEDLEFNLNDKPFKGWLSI